MAISIYSLFALLICATAVTALGFGMVMNRRLPA